MRFRGYILPAVFGLWLLHGEFNVAIAGDATPRVPPPAGFIDGAGLSERIRAMGLAGQTPAARLVGMYYPTNALAEILRDGDTAPCPFCKAVLKEYETLSDAKKGFQILVKNAKKEGDSFDPNGAAMKRIFKHFEDAARKVEPSVSVKAGGATILGTTLEKENVFASCAILNFKWANGQAQVDMPFAVALSWLRIGKHQVELGVLYPFRDATSVTSANQKMLDWIAEIQKRNSQK